MKKLLIVAAAICGLFFTLPAMAQTGVRFGVKAGGSLNFSKINVGNLSINGDNRLGFYGGGLMEISPNFPQNKFKVQLEALYSRVNMEFLMSDQTGAQALTTIGVNQINIPLLAKYFVLPKLSVNLGPTFNFNLNGKATYEETSGTHDEGDLTDYNTFQIGLAAGATYYICEGFFVDARYTPIFGSLNKSLEGYENTAIKMSAVKLGIGFKF